MPGVPGVSLQMQADPVPVREAVAGAFLVGERLEAERAVVSQRRPQVAHREDGIEAAQQAGWPGPARSGDDVGLLDSGQRAERRAQGADLFRRHDGFELAVDRLDPAQHRCHHVFAAFGRRQTDPPAVVGVRLAFQIAPVDQKVDYLAHSLLGHPQLGRQVVPRPARGVDPGQDERAVPRQVVNPDRVQLRPDGLRVRPAGRSHQGRGGKLAPVAVGHAGHAIDKLLVSQITCSFSLCIDYRESLLDAYLLLTGMSFTRRSRQARIGQTKESA